MTRDPREISRFEMLRLIHEMNALSLRDDPRFLEIQAKPNIPTVPLPPPGPVSNEPYLPPEAYLEPPLGSGNRKERRAAMADRRRAARRK